MQIPKYILGGLATSVAATTLYVSDYGGSVTTLSLSALPQGGYSLEKTSSYNEASIGGANARQPSWLTLDPKNDIMYLVDENWSGLNGSVTTYKTSSTGELSLVRRLPMKPGPVHTSILNNGKALITANYGSATVSSYLINPIDGSLTLSQIFSWSQDPLRSIPSRPHETIVDPTGSYIIVPDLGSDLLRVFSIDNTTSLLTEQTAFGLLNDTGPRHGAFHRTSCGQTFLFVVAEYKPLVTSYLVTYPTTKSGSKDLVFKQVFQDSVLGPHKALPSLPDSFGHYAPFAAEAIVSPCGKFLLTSTRQDYLFNITNPDPTNSTLVPSDSLQVWGINQATGVLTFKQLAAAGGVQPRQFSLNGNGTLVAVGSNIDNRVAIIERDGDGLFGEIVAYYSIGGQVTSVIWDE